MINTRDSWLHTEQNVLFKKVVFTVTDSFLSFIHDIFYAMHLKISYEGHFGLKSLLLYSTESRMIFFIMIDYFIFFNIIGFVDSTTYN